MITPASRETAEKQNIEKVIQISGCCLTKKCSHCLVVAASGGESGVVSLPAQLVLVSA